MNRFDIGDRVRFSEFLDTHYPNSRKEFAEKANLSLGHLYNLENGKRPFSRKDMVKIFVASGGRVRFEDMVADELRLAARA